MIDSLLLNVPSVAEGKRKPTANHTLLGEPLILNALELVILIVGSLVEGLVIAFFWRADPRAVQAQ